MICKVAFFVTSLIASYSLQILRELIMSFEQNWVDITNGDIPGARIVRKSLKLAEGEDVGKVLEKKKGCPSKELGGWLLDFRSLAVTPLDSSGRWLNVEGDFAIFTPTAGLQMTTTFSPPLEDGQALCVAKVRVFLMPLYL